MCTSMSVVVVNVRTTIEGNRGIFTMHFLGLEVNMRTAMTSDPSPTVISSTIDSLRRKLGQRMSTIQSTYVVDGAYLKTPAIEHTDPGFRPPLVLHGNAYEKALATHQLESREEHQWSKHMPSCGKYTTLSEGV